MQYAIVKTELQYFTSKRLQNDPDELGMKKIVNSTFLIQRLNFLRSFYGWKFENVQQRTNAFSSRLFEGRLQFHVRKEPQSDPELVEKEVLAVVWQISEL